MPLHFQTSNIVVSPEKTRELLTDNPLTRETIVQICSGGIRVKFEEVMCFTASIDPEMRNGKIINGFYVIKINKSRNKTERGKAISILHELTHIHVWCLLGFIPANDNPWSEERELTEPIIDEYAEKVYESKIINLDELQKLCNANV